MSKRKNAVEFPDIVNMDDLAVLSDEELSGRASRMESDRRRAASTSSNLIPWEVEVAYVRREQQIREDRAKAHASYLATHGTQPAEVVEEEDIDEEVE